MKNYSGLMDKINNIYENGNGADCRIICETKNELFELFQFLKTTDWFWTSQDHHYHFQDLSENIQEKEWVSVNLKSNGKLLKGRYKDYSIKWSDVEFNNSIYPIFN